MNWGLRLIVCLIFWFVHVEDTAHLTKERCFTNLLSSLFSSFFCPLSSIVLRQLCLSHQVRDLSEISKKGGGGGVGWGDKQGRVTVFWTLQKGGLWKKWQENRERHKKLSHHGGKGTLQCHVLQDNKLRVKLKACNYLTSMVVHYSHKKITVFWNHDCCIKW